ncbi:probable (S)-N-methylcoclaurine 3'-hydroxylase isozyme 2 [Tanacetum coccineum]
MLYQLFFLIVPLLALIIAVRFRAKEGTSQKRQNLPPGPYSWPILGNLPYMLKGPHIYLTRTRTYGPLCSVKLGTHLFIIGSSPMAATEIMRSFDRVPSSRWVPKAGQDGLQEYSLIWATQCTEHWKALRSLCRNELFSSKGLELQAYIREKNVHEMVGFLRFKQGKVVNIRELVLMKLGTTPNIADFYPIFEGLDPQRLKKRTLEAMNESFSVWEHIIKDRRDAREADKGVDFDDKDFLDTMLRCGFSDLQINQLTVELFSGGTHSTASTIEWALAELIKLNKKLSFSNPKIETYTLRHTATMPSMQSLEEWDIMDNDTGPKFLWARFQVLHLVSEEKKNENVYWGSLRDSAGLITGIKRVAVFVSLKYFPFPLVLSYVRNLAMPYIIIGVVFALSVTVFGGFDTSKFILRTSSIYLLISLLDPGVGVDLRVVALV